LHPKQFRIGGIGVVTKQNYRSRVFWSNWLHERIQSIQVRPRGRRQEQERLEQEQQPGAGRCDCFPFSCSCLLPLLLAFRTSGIVRRRPRTTGFLACDNHPLPSSQPHHVRENEHLSPTSLTSMRKAEE